MSTSFTLHYVSVIWRKAQPEEHLSCHDPTEDTVNSNGISFVRRDEW